jgi:hypothetical protein
LSGASALDDVFIFNASNTPTTATLQAAIDTFVNPSFTGTMGVIVYVSGAIVGSPVTLSLTRIQWQDITGRTDQTTPSEYVSVGVTSAPYYHGSFVDGVKCFPTDLSGNPIPSTTLLGYSAEGARTNLWTYSQDFDNAAWTKSTITVAANDAVAPDGTTTADKLTNDDTASVLDRTATVTANTTYTDSIHLKYGNNAWARILYGAGANAVQLWVNIQTGTIGTVTASSGTAVLSAYSIESVSGGFWRIQAAVNLGGAITTFQRRSYLVNADNSGTIVAAAYAHHWGAQVELGSFASSYIATTTIAVARNADVLTYSGGDIASLKTIMAGFRCAPGVNTGAARVVASLSPGASIFAEYIDAGSFQLGATDFWFQGIDNNVGQWVTQCSNTYTPGTSAKAASSWATNDIKMSFNGVAQTADTVATMPTVTALYVGSGSGITQLNGNVGGIYGWTRNLSQSELNAVTA